MFKINNLSQQEALKYAIDNGMIDMEYVQSIIDMQKREELIKKHPYKIWQAKNGKWYTYLPDEKKKSIQRERYSKKEIEDVIVKYWKQFEDNPTVKDIFMEYYNKKLTNNEISKATYDRYEMDFNKYFCDFGKQRIKDVSELDIDDFVHSVINTHNLTAKAYSGVRTLLYGIFKHAKSDN